MFNIFKQAKCPLGFDLSDLSLKIIQLAQHKEKVCVQAFSDVSIPKEAFWGDKIKDTQLLVKIIRQAINSSKFGKFTSSEVVASIPETKSFVRVIQIPTMTESEIKEAVPWEAEAYIPLPVGQVYLDWAVVKNPALDGKINVLITASPKDYVDELVAVLKAANLKPVALETESQATVRSIVSNERESIMIADIDAVRTSLIVYDQKTLQCTFSLPVGGSIFTESISKALDVDLEQAERIKRRVGLEDSAQGAKLKKALTPVLNNIIEEIKNSLRFFEEHSAADSRINRLVLTGGSSKLKHLPSYLQDKLTKQTVSEHPLRSLPGIKVELGNPLINLSMKNQPPSLSREDSLGYATSIGLAFREMR